MRPLALLAVFGGVASAAPMSVTGTVSQVESRYTADGSEIVTDATISTPDGDVQVTQFGGTVDGITMRTLPGDPPLVLGQTVIVNAHAALDLSQQPHNVVDDYTVLADPEGFVRTGPTKAGHYLYWESGCVFLTPDSLGTTEIAGNNEFQVIDASVATWNNDTMTSSCSYMKVVEEPPKEVEVGKDYTNVLKFRDTPCADCQGHWCRPATSDAAAICHSPAAAGLTTVAYIDDASSSRDGALVDADIELNGVDFAISVNGITMGTQTCNAELQNTLTHELGHLHGLEHTCRAPNDPPRIDNNGNPVPFCAQTTDPMILNATMYNYQDCGETKKETLETDDINAICTTYPVANDPHSCAPVSMSSGCCSAGRDARGSLLLAAGVFAFLRRRRASPGSAGARSNS